jgi:hypothetical protein
MIRGEPVQKAKKCSGAWNTRQLRPRFGCWAASCSCRRAAAARLENPQKSLPGVRGKSCNLQHLSPLFPSNILPQS